MLYSVTELLPSSLVLMVYVCSNPLTSAGSVQLTVKVVSFTLNTFRLPTGPDSEGTNRISNDIKCIDHLCVNSLASAVVNSILGVLGPSPTEVLADTCTDIV